MIKCICLIISYIIFKIKRTVLLTISAFLLIIAPCKGQSQTYFQQKADYKIDVLLDDVRHILNGMIEIDYYNNSPDTLSTILFHLWPNAYMDERTALSKQLVENGRTSLFYADDEERGFIDSLRFTVNDKWVTVRYDYKGYADINGVRKAATH